MAEVLQSASSTGTAGVRPCPECGGHLEWSAARQALACPYCGTVMATFSGRGRVDGKRDDRADDASGDRVGGSSTHVGDGVSAAGATEAAGNVGAAGMSTEKRTPDRREGVAVTMPGPGSGVEEVSAVGAFGHSAEDMSLAQEAEALFGRGVPDHHALYEQDLEAALRNPANLRNWGAERHEVKCQNCHAISVFVNGKVADRCDFCGSPAIVTHEEMRDAITPQSLLPFRISESQVRDVLRTWYRSRWFAPNRLKRAAATDTLKGVYLPYWTFDARAHSRWQAESGRYYYTTEMARGTDGRMETRRVQHVQWIPSFGELEHLFDDELVPGTVGIHGKLLKRIEPFPTTTDLKAYSPDYVRGWTVERYQVDLREATTQGRQQMQLSMEALCSREVPGDTHRNLRVETRFDDCTFKHVLVPIWLVRYDYGARNFQVLVNGYTGKVAGEQPWSWVKIALAVLLVLAVLAGLSMLNR